MSTGAWLLIAAIVAGAAGLVIYLYLEALGSMGFDETFWRHHQ